MKSMRFHQPVRPRSVYIQVLGLLVFYFQLLSQAWVSYLVAVVPLQDGGAVGHDALPLGLGEGDLLLADCPVAVDGCALVDEGHVVSGGDVTHPFQSCFLPLPPP